MKVSRSKTEYMCVNERGDGERFFYKELRFQRFRSLGIWDQLYNVMEVVVVR